MTHIDIAARDVGAFLVVGPLTPAGEAWLDEHLSGEDEWRGGSLYVEHRFGPDLLMGAHMDGLTVALDGQIADAPR